MCIKQQPSLRSTKENRVERLSNFSNISSNVYERFTCMAKGRDVYHNLNNNSDGRLDDNIVDADYKRKEPSVAIDGEMTRAKVHRG